MAKRRRFSNGNIPSTEIPLALPIPQRLLLKTEAERAALGVLSDEVWAGSVPTMSQLHIELHKQFEHATSVLSAVASIAMECPGSIDAESCLSEVCDKVLAIATAEIGSNDLSTSEVRFILYKQAR